MTELLAIEVAKAIGAEATIASREGVAIEGSIPVEEAEVPTGTTRGRITLSGLTVETSILPVDVVQLIAQRSTVVARSWLGA